METLDSSPPCLNPIEQKQLLHLARISIQHGLVYGKLATVLPENLEGNLGKKGASFVTLFCNKKLRGCIGYLEPQRPLAIDVSNNAYASAFNDSRFPPLQQKEWEDLEIKISVLSQWEPIAFSAEKDLIQQLRPHVDGLILTEGSNHSTFLPSVWSDLPSAKEFLKHLKKKAGLPAHYWSPTIQISRYTTLELGENYE